ncbi:hypothetical protein GWI33_019052 [Rhynchophorus ferrugineus]|uniref:Uncharacterized protein n=1 Tax=Rhynchophorus ferrugineus TaxID=354439 RepID=A0A834HV72_RHYFE|nr:hypothetical protein GWI33_019052 [Rhynchophorus ferrugineus]
MVRSVIHTSTKPLFEPFTECLAATCLNLGCHIHNRKFPFVRYLLKVTIYRRLKTETKVEIKTLSATKISELFSDDSTRQSEISRLTSF